MTYIDVRCDYCDTYIGSFHYNQIPQAMFEHYVRRHPYELKEIQDSEIRTSELKRKYKYNI